MGVVRGASVGARDVDLGHELDQHRAGLTAYCYRMLASPFEAEDAVQETFLRAWRGFESFEGRSAIKTWLHRIATNVCIDMLRGREHRARPMDIGPARAPVESNLKVLSEVTWIEPIPDSLIGVEPDDLWLSGRDDMFRWWFGPGSGCRGSRLLPTVTANGSPAYGQYKPSATGTGYEPWSLQVIELAPDGVTEITFFLSTKTLFPLFGLPLHLDA